MLFTHFFREDMYYFSHSMQFCTIIPKKEIRRLILFLQFLYLMQ